MTNILKVPQILLPNQTVDRSKWATVACDQFCAEPEYWKRLENFVDGAPSTLRLVVPEIFLNGNMEPKINAVHKAMNDYIKQGLLTPYEGLILVEREVSGGCKRIGLMVSFDLDAYDWRRVRVPVRATEDTLIERLPIRVEIRSKASLEFPHAILLVEDRQKEIIETLYANKDSYQKLYEFDLNMNGGKITGYAVPNPEDILQKLEALLDPSLQTSKYGDDAGILFAVGDGNHSLAAAKIWWDELKNSLTPAQRENHPARYMLAEVINIYGSGMNFQPIHRLLYNTDGEDFLKGLRHRLRGEGSLGIVTSDGIKYIEAPQDAATTIKLTQEFIEDYLKENTGVKIEYVHSAEHLNEVIAERGGMGLVMPAFPASSLFDYVVNVGNLPKKAFSIGEPEDKRYYLEAKKIVY